MFLKYNKYGIRSGNTFRAVNSKYKRRYRKDAFIIRRDAVLDYNPDSDLPDVCEGIDIPVEHVPFSLNKQQRWLLPEVIQDLIYESYECIDTEDRPRICSPGLELIERHKIAQNNNAVGIYCSKTEHTGTKSSVPEVHNANKGYIDADNILGTCPLYSRKTKRSVFLNNFSSLIDDDDLLELYDRYTKQDEEAKKGKDDTDVDKKPDVEPPVRYEVILPAELSTCCSQKPKKIGQDTRKKLKYTQNRRPTRLVGSKRFSHSKQKCNGWRQDDINDGLQYYNETKEYYDCRVEQTDSKSTQHVNIKHESAVDTSVQNNNETRGSVKNKHRKPRKRRKQSKEKTKPEVIVSEVDETRTEDVDPNLTCPHNHAMGETSVRFSMKYEPVVFLLLKEDLAKSKLEDIYGTDYLECLCYPRRFVINISNYINNLDGVGSAFKLIQIHDRQTMAWLVFVHLPHHELNNSILEAYEVHLNANFDHKVKSFKLDGKTNDDYTNISEIIGQTLVKIKSMPAESIIFESPLKVTPFINRKRLLEEMFDCSSHSYFPDSEYLIKHLSDRFSTIRNKSEPSDQLSCMTSETRIHDDLVTLLPCQHTYCKECWCKHLHILSDTGTTDIVCLHDTCHQTIDLSMLISILDVKTILKLAVKFHKESVQNNALTNWCSTENCGRVITIDNNKVSFAKCDCKGTMCIECQGKPHWPMSCMEYKQYIHMLLDSGDINKIPQDFVMKYQVSFCSNCYKNSSVFKACSKNKCVCNNHLCASCYHILHSYTLDEDVKSDVAKSSVITEETHETKTHDSVFLTDQKHHDYNLNNSRSKHYKLATKHRLAQHPFRTAKIRACSKLLAKRIKRYILQEDMKRNYVYLHFVLDGDNGRRESEKVIKYFDYIADLYIDINNIVECYSMHLFFKTKDNEEEKNVGQLHRRIMTVSLCGQELCDLLKNGAFMNPSTVLDKLKSIRKEIDRVTKQLSSSV